MKKGLLVVVLAILAVTSQAAEEVRTFSCRSATSHVWEEEKVSVSLPLPNIIKAAIKRVTKGIPDPLLPEIGVKIEWTLKDTLHSTLDCDCPPSPADCCSGREAEALARLSLYQVLTPPKDPVTKPQFASALTLPINSGQNIRRGGARLCEWVPAVTLATNNYRGSVGIARAIGLKWVLDVEVASAAVTINADHDCWCNPDRRCLQETNPPMVEVPAQVVVPKGEEAVLTVLVRDKDGDAARVVVSEGARVLHTSRAENGVLKAQIAVSSAVPSTAWGEVLVRVMAADTCGNRHAANIPVVVVHPPTLTLCEELWKRSDYEVKFEVVDPDLARCARRGDFVEHITLTYGVAPSVAGTFLGPYTKEVRAGCALYPTGRIPGHGCAIAYFTPPRAGVPRFFTLSITATDAWGLSAGWMRRFVNGLPVLNELSAVPQPMSPIRVRRGGTVTARITFSDPDGDWLVLRKVSGPGDFPEASGSGTVTGHYSWQAESFQYLHLVRFEAQDYVIRGGLPYQGAAYTHFWIHVLQPPTVHRASTWVPRGSKTTATIYVSDPDSTSHSFDFRPPSGITVGKPVTEEPRDYEEQWGALYYTVDVSVDQSLCPGTYSVPFTVTDPDGNSASATLTVYVRGNQAPRAHGELSGRAAVTLTPAGVVGRLAWLGPVRLTDPEGDRITLVGLGDPPNFGSANLFIFGSALRVPYQPRVSEAELCQAVRERDVLVEEFTVVVRDACGAEAEIPGTVTITVVDRVPPRIIVPAQDLIVECDGAGNRTELEAWLENHGGAQGYNNRDDCAHWRTPVCFCRVYASVRRSAKSNRDLLRVAGQGSQKGGQYAEQMAERSPSSVHRVS